MPLPIHHEEMRVGISPSREGPRSLQTKARPSLSDIGPAGRSHKYRPQGFFGSPDDIEVRAGDSLTIPKQPGAVLVIGQVYNSNALTYTPGRNAGWYLSHAGGPTKLADKGATFIVRADGSVSTGRQGGFWSGSVLSTAMGPGDTIVVPERPVLGSNTLKNVL